MVLQINIDERYRNSPRELCAILGHEMGHVFLDRAGIRRADTLANEILTDTTAAMYGFGLAMAGAYRAAESRRRVAGGFRIARRESNLGYLTPDELGYVLTRTGYQNIHRHLLGSDLHAARAALRYGRRRAIQEIRTPPLRNSPPWARLLYYGGRWLAAVRRTTTALDADGTYALEPAHVVFRCPQCCQPLRIPTAKQVIARCPNCDSRLPCKT